MEKDFCRKFPEGSHFCGDHFQASTWSNQFLERKKICLSGSQLNVIVLLGVFPKCFRRLAKLSKSLGSAEEGVRKLLHSGWHDDDCHGKRFDDVYQPLTLELTNSQGWSDDVSTDGIGLLRARTSLEDFSSSSFEGPCWSLSLHDLTYFELFGCLHSSHKNFNELRVVNGI